MLSLAKVPSQRDPIVFTDQTIEHSMVLEKLLDIIIDCEMTPTEDTLLIKYVIHLAQKWDFKKRPQNRAHRDSTRHL